MALAPASGSEKVVIKDSNGQDVIIAGKVESPSIQGGSVSSIVRGETTPVIIKGEKSSLTLQAQISGSNDEYVTAAQQRLETAAGALRGTEKFANPKRIKDRNLNWDSKVHDRVQGRLVKTSAKADQKGIRPGKKARLERKEARLEKRLDKIGNSNSRLDAIMDVSGDLGIKDPASFAETKAKLLGLGDGIEVSFQIEALAKSPEEIIQRGLDAYRLVNEFALPEGSTRQDELKSNVALRTAGEEYDKQLGIYNRLPADSGARKSVQDKLNVILKQNPRLKAIAEAAVALGLKNPTFAQAYARLEEYNQEVLIADRKATELLLNFNPSQPVPVVKNGKKSDEDKLVTLEASALHLLQLAQDIEGDEFHFVSKEFDDKSIPNAYNDAAKAYAELALKKPDFLLEEARCFVKAGDFASAKSAVEKYLQYSAKQKTPDAAKINEANNLLSTIEKFIKGSSSRAIAENKRHSKNLNDILNAAEKYKELGLSENGRPADLLKAGLLYIRSNKYKKALDCLEAYAKIVPSQEEYVKDLIEKEQLRAKAGTQVYWGVEQ